ncbi:MAG: hypothetical protein EBR40_03090 [Proteobacteria bacterium]|nr:hypothetical protein [Pseudomonadota bacterium]
MHKFELKILILMIMLGEDRATRARDEGLMAAAFSAVVITASLLSCQPTWIKRPQPAYSWVFQERASVCVSVADDQIEDVVEAVRAWDQAIGRWKHLEVRTNFAEEGACDYVIREMPASFVQNRNVLATVVGIDMREVHMFKGRYEEDALTITLHELGHVFGAKHLQGTLMDPHLGRRYTCPDAATVAQVAVNNAVDPSVFTYCKED